MSSLVRLYYLNDLFTIIRRGGFRESGTKCYLTWVHSISIYTIVCIYMCVCVYMLGWMCDTVFGRVCMNVCMYVFIYVRVYVCTGKNDYKMAVHRY